MGKVGNWVIALAFCGIGIILLYLFIDRPVSYFAHENLREFRPIFDWIGWLPKVLGPIVVGCTCIFGVQAAMRRPLTRFQTAVTLSALSLTISDKFENWLKFAFGRTWPETWVQDNPSLIREGVHSFNLFHGGPGYAAFPSGHMVAICAILSVFWVTYPRFRLLYGVGIAGVFLGQCAANYHFVSDVVAGGFLGFSVGLMIVLIWNAGMHPVGMKLR